MASGRYRPAARDNRLAWCLALACAAIFMLGVFVGYHSIYRSIDVAMLPPPPAAAPL